MTFIEELENWYKSNSYKDYLKEKISTKGRDALSEEESEDAKTFTRIKKGIDLAKSGKKTFVPDVKRDFNLTGILNDVRNIDNKGFQYGYYKDTDFSNWLEYNKKSVTKDHDALQKILGSRVNEKDIDNYGNLSIGQKAELMNLYGYDYNNANARKAFEQLISNRNQRKAMQDIWEPETNWYGVNKKTGEFQPLNWLQEMSMQYGPAKLMADYAKENWQNIDPDPTSWQGGGMLGRGLAGVGINTLETLNPAKGISVGGKVLMKPVENKVGQFVLGNALAPAAYTIAEEAEADEIDPRRAATNLVVGTAVNAAAPVKAGRTEGTLRQYVPGSEGISKWLELPEEKVRTTVARATKEADAPIIYKDFAELANAKGEAIPYTIGLNTEPATWVSKNPKLGEKMVTPEQHQKAVDVYEAFAGPHAKGYPDVLKKDALYAFDPDVVNAFENMGDKIYLKTGINDAIAYGTNKAGEEKWATKPFSIIGFDPTKYAKEQEEQKQVAKAKKQAEGAGINIDYVPEGLTYDEQKVVEMIQNNPGLTIGFGKPEDVARVSKFLMLHPEYGRIGTFKVE